MKALTVIILTLSLNIALGQDSLQFKVTTLEGLKQSTYLQIVSPSEKLGFDFYKKHFRLPYYYPNQMVNLNHANDTVVVWNDSTKVNDYKANWSYTIVYDSHSRVIEYCYSGCLICSQLPYNYQFFYNKQGQVTSITNNLHEKEKIDFQYDTNGNIVKIKVYRGASLIKKIELLNKK
jgi:YD repeat-containing protein